MITVTVFTGSGKAVGIEMNGHAGSAGEPLENQDLVCAAASALALSMANSVEHFTDDLFSAEVGEESGYFRFLFQGPASDKAELLMNSLILALTDLCDSYGEPYLTIRFQEV